MTWILSNNSIHNKRFLFFKFHLELKLSMIKISSKAHKKYVDMIIADSITIFFTVGKVMVNIWLFVSNYSVENPQSAFKI